METHFGCCASSYSFHAENSAFSNFIQKSERGTITHPCNSKNEREQTGKQRLTKYYTGK
jgi:hypothetical protein